jgi:hypothetical protein
LNKNTRDIYPGNSMIKAFEQFSILSGRTYLMQTSLPSLHPMFFISWTKGSLKTT